MRHLSEEDTDAILAGLTLAGMIIGGLGQWAFADRPAGAMAGIAGLALVYLAGGVPAGLRALRTLWVERVLDIDLLMVIAALAAAAVGAAAEGAVLLTLFSLSTTLEHRAMGRAQRAVEALMALRPDTALLLGPEGVREVPVEDLRPGDVVVLRPGARVPVDGVIRTGEGALDEATITGESMPVHKLPGAPVFEATVNLNAVLEVTVSRGIAESTVARMIALVTEAQAAKAPSERFSAWFGQRYTVVVLLGSVLAFAVLLWLGLGWDAALYRAATLLVAASPCAIVISVPAAILSALSAAARGGVLFKGGAAVETLAAVRTFAFDKTGTLTTGKAEVTGLV
ncbi:MAG: HAD-IC family P-type ATPase, partial [Cereibacter changlensis]